MRTGQRAIDRSAESRSRQSALHPHVRLPTALRDHARRIGLLAGWGRYPLVVAEALRRQGYEIYCLGVAGHADPQLAEVCDDFQWSGLAKLRRGDPLLPAPRRDRRDDGRQDPQGACSSSRGAGCGTCPTCGRSARSFRISSRGSKDCQDDTLLGAIVERVRRARASASARPPTTRRSCSWARGNSPAAARRPAAVERHRLRLADGQGDGPARHRPERGRQGPGGAGRRGRRGDRRVHPPRGHALPRRAASPWSRWPSRSRTCGSTCPPSACGTLETLVAAGGRVLAIEAGRTILLDAPRGDRLRRSARSCGGGD